jgi:hypothetical protein
MSLSTACHFGTTAGNIRVGDRNWTWNRHDCGRQSSNANHDSPMAIMNRSIAMRLLAVGILIAAEIAAATALLVVAPELAGAQRLEDFFPFFQQRGRRSWFAPPERDAPPPDYSKAPAPKKADAVPQTPIMVFGDSMADWLAYGLEQAFIDSPEIGILRRRYKQGSIRTAAFIRVSARDS